MSDGIIVRIFLPELRGERANAANPNVVSREFMQDFYNLAVLPAAIEVIPERVRRTWPANYDDEMFRAGNRPGDAEDPAEARVQPQHSGRDVHASHLNRWINAIRHKVIEQHALRFAMGFFFVVEGRGMKTIDGIQHEPLEEDILDDGTTFPIRIQGVPN